MLQFYHYAQCSTCRKAQKWLENHQKSLEPVDITTLPPSPWQLRKALKASGKKITDLLNTSGVQYRQMNLKEKIKTLSEDQLLELLSQNGRLIKRPLVFEGEKATIGFKEDEFNKTWKK